MTDQCKHCTLRGDITACKATPCYKHEDWYAVEQQKQLDQLTAINQELVEALERILSWDEVDVETRINIGSNGVQDYYRSVAEKALKRAKELTK